MIIDIRGTNGAGKSFIPHTILTQYYNEPILAMPDRPAGYYIPALNLAVVGRYESPCGGCDGITNQSLIGSAAYAHWAAGRHVLIEGSIVGTVFKRWDLLARRVDDDYVFGFLDTPLDLCIERVRARRQARGDTRPFDPGRTLIPRYRSIQRIRAKLDAAGRRTWTISHRDLEGVKQIVERVAHEKA